jgi:hypothetical protein
LFAFLIAAFVAAEPLLHTHPLRRDSANAASSSSCAICAAHIGRLPIPVPTIAAPQVIVYTVVAPIVITITVLNFSPRTSRAPPAA